MRAILKLKLIILLLPLVLVVGCADNSSGTNNNFDTRPQESSNSQRESYYPPKESLDSGSMDKNIEIRNHNETKEDRNLNNDDYYINSDNEKVHSPARSPSKPDGATAQCEDGTYSFSHSRRGTCSHHGGVATWY